LGVFSQFRRFSRDARLLLALMFIVAIGYFGILTLLRALFVLRLGRGPEYVGLYGAVSSMSFALMCLPGGALGRRFGMRRVMRIAGPVMVLGMFLLPVARFTVGWVQYLWPLAAQGLAMFGWATLWVNMGPALLAATAPERRNAAFALLTALRSAGMFVGTLIGGALPGFFATRLGTDLEAPGPYGWAIWVGAAVASLSIVPLLGLGQLEPTPEAVADEEDDSDAPFPVLAVAVVLAHVVLTHVAWSTVQSFGDAYLDRQLRLPTASIGILAAAAQLASVAAPLIGPRLTASRGAGWVLGVASAGLGLGLLPLALVPHWAPAGLSRLLVLTLSGIWMPVVQVYMLQLAPVRWRTVVYGASSMGTAAAYGIASYVGGQVVAAAGYNRAFMLAAILPLIGSVLIWGAQRLPAMRKANAT
jgi:MFS family permease